MMVSVKTKTTKIITHTKKSYPPLDHVKILMFDRRLNIMLFGNI